MTTRKNILLSMLATLAFAFGCDNAPAADGGVDSGRGDALAPFVATCADYCGVITASCTGDNLEYTNMAECMSVCSAANWAPGDAVTPAGPTSGNTIGCRTYHAGVAGMTDPETHCPHAGAGGGGVCGSVCEAYCALAIGGCTGANQIYANGEECMAACAGFDASGDFGATSGDTVQCRIYHLTVAITTDAALHCPHGAPDGGGVCVGGWDFRTDDPSSYTRVDRMGMPAVATALVDSADATGGPPITKNQYNDANPIDDAMGTFVPELAHQLTAIHGVLDDDIIGLGLVPCMMAPMTRCFSQEVAPGVAVADLVVPDTLTINTSADPGFPNGRALADPVIDVTLAIILLDLTAPGQDAATLAGVPVNPGMNDVAFLTDFPFLAPPHAP